MWEYINKGVPKWSPDGRWIAYLSDMSGDANIWIIPAQT